jgi:hypothetical protein
MKIEKLDLRELGAALEVDRDHALTEAPTGVVLAHFGN